MKCIVNKNIVNPLRQGWCELLDFYKWTYFITLTFRDLPKTYTAINRAKHFLRYVERQVKHKIGYYLCMEYTRAGTPHFHLLVGNLEGSRYAIFHKWWFDRYGITRFKTYDPKKRAIHYLTKYILKRTAWYDIQGVDTLEKKDILSLPLNTQGVDNE